MNKVKADKLVIYSNDLKNKLNSVVPEKHKDSPTTYKQWLNREIDIVARQLAEFDLVEPNKK